ncbi:hypothetical protein [Brevibacillus sp. NRS-1366]|uniref:hypothetical protein n=1 Tax=Brevibacillus sp. NRS-1366 TaxID=3233899 RepID=UPI003D24BA6C
MTVAYFSSKKGGAEGNGLPVKRMVTHEEGCGGVGMNSSLPFVGWFLYVIVPVSTLIITAVILLMIKKREELEK